MISTNLNVIAIRQRRSGKQWILGRGKAKGRSRTIVKGGEIASQPPSADARNDRLLQTTLSFVWEANKPNWSLNKGSLRAKRGNLTHPIPSFIKMQYL